MTLEQLGLVPTGSLVLKKEAIDEPGAPPPAGTLPTDFARAAGNVSSV